MNSPRLNRRMTVEQLLDWSDARGAEPPCDEPKWELLAGLRARPTR